MNRVTPLVCVACVACSLLVQPDRSAPTGHETLDTLNRSAATPLAASAIVGASSVPVSLLIENTGEDDRLLAASSPVAAMVDLHHSRLIDGRRVMISASEGIAIPGGKSVLLEPGASHLMLLDLNTTLVQGGVFPLTMRFERAGEVIVSARVRRKVDAAGIAPIPPVTAGELRISLASAPPALATISMSATPCSGAACSKSGAGQARSAEGKPRVDP